MNISLTPELENFIESRVESGFYSSASEVVRAGLRLLSEQDISRRINNLKLEILRGLESADEELISDNEINVYLDKIIDDAR
ncbi:MAG: type II toxin-antitoxin system ParD family antitoxin [Rickettsiales bacterium]|nr:type II toxin-antitoxin system ParD family antitoxin [Rickettsiales bacterium]